MATAQEIQAGITREATEAGKELAHFKAQATTVHTIGHTLVTLVKDRNDGRSSIKKTALERAVQRIEGKGIVLPVNMNFFFSSEARVRCVAFMSAAATPDVFIGPKVCQLNPLQPHTATAVTGGLGAVGVRGVSSQIYDATRGNFLGIGDPKLKAQATSIIVHELGHVLHSQLAASTFWDCKNGDAMRGVGWDVVATEVSHYATNNALEFVAETFCGTIMGRTYGAGVQAAYAALGGPTSLTFWN